MDEYTEKWKRKTAPVSVKGVGQRAHYDSLQPRSPQRTPHKTAYQRHASPKSTSVQIATHTPENRGMLTVVQDGSGPHRDPVAADEGPRLLPELQEFVLDLRSGPEVPGRLTSALLLAMRRGDEKHLVELCVAACPAVGERALEDCLDEAWRTACALNLPLSEDMKLCVVDYLTLLRYHLSRADPTIDAPPAADARWDELWGRVDLLLEYSSRLHEELERLQGHERAPGSTDKCVLLARMCALTLHGVKGSFLSTYKDVPWEEMEYLLVMFIEVPTVPVTLAHLVATASSTAAHLQCFRERVGEYVLVHRSEPDPEVAMRRLKKEPWKERADLLVGVVDSALTDLRKDFALLRDWHSLKEINNSMGVTSEALRLEDKAWVAWGWLALGWALFVVGERVKYSWTSPNLSPRWAVLPEAMAHGGVLEVMSAIRDDQAHAHGKDSSNDASSGMKKQERTKLAEELEKLKKAVHVALVKVESEMEQGDCGSEAKTLALPKKTESEREVLSEELRKLTRAAKAALQAAEKEVEWTEDSDLHWDRAEHARVDSKGRKDLILEEHLKILSKATSLPIAHGHIPAVPLVVRLLYKSAEHTKSVQALLREVTPSVSSPPFEILRRELTALAVAPEGQLRDFAIKGALRELVSRWHERDQAMPSAVPFSPALFGRQLRNYLNHLDEVFRSHLEMNALYNLLRAKWIPLEHGARPRPRDPQRSRAENERLLRLVELKNDMFRCAREGDLGELQRLVEDGADVSARDCQDRTLLHAAAQGGQVHVVRWLLGLGAEAVDPLARDWCGHTALHMASTAAVAETLLDANKTANSDRQQSGAWTPLHAAAASGRAEVVAVLLRDPRALDAVDHNGLTPLHWAARQGQDQVVRLLIAAGARCQADADGDTPLVAAACSGSAPTVRLLLGARGVSNFGLPVYKYAGFLGSLMGLLAGLPGLPTFWGRLVWLVNTLRSSWAPLVSAAPPPAAEDCWRAAKYAAAFAREEACFALLDELEARGLLQWGPEAREVLLQAGWGGSSAITLRLLDRWPKSLRERLDDTTGATVLHLAALNGHAELVRALLTPSSGADPLGEAAEGLTALDGAAVSGSPDTIDALVEHIPGGSLQAALTRALCVAAQRGQLRAAQRLVQHGADVNAVDGEGRTPLCWAAVRGHTEVVRWLLQRGADPWWGKPLPLHLAAAYGRLSVVKLLVPPLHAGDQDDPGGEEPSALSVAVQAGSREDLQRILERFVEHLRPLSSRYTREDRLRDKAKAMAALRRKEREEGERLSLLQQSDIGGRTALHLAAAVSALPVVEYLLEREGELLRRVYSKHKNTGVPRQDGLTVYARDAKGRTALQYGAARLCTPSVVEALLQRMADEMWMALGHKDLREVLSMAVDVLELAEPQLGSRRLCGAIRHWLGLSSSGPCVNEHEHARNWWTR